MTNKKQEAKISDIEYSIFRFALCLVIILYLIFFINLFDKRDVFTCTPTYELYCTTAEHDRLLTTSKLHGCYFAEEEHGNLVKLNGEWIHRYWLVSYDFKDVKFRVIYQGE